MGASYSPESETPSTHGSDGAERNEIDVFYFFGRSEADRCLLAKQKAELAKSPTPPSRRDGSETYAITRMRMNALK